MSVNRLKKFASQYSETKTSDY